MKAYRLSLSLIVDDAERLWSAAAAYAMALPGMTNESVADTIGPRAAPSLDDCLAMLLAPERFAGCSIEALAIEAMAGGARGATSLDSSRCAHDPIDQTVRAAGRARRASCGLFRRATTEVARR